VLAVVAVSAAIRLDWGNVSALRVVHRTAASLEVIFVLWIGWLLFRARRQAPARWRVAAIALALTVFLSVLGIAAGQSPPRLQAMGNLLGGLALASAFAWLVGAAGRSGAAIAGTFAAVAGALLAAQAVVGARLSIFGRTDVPALPAHAMLGLATAALLGWLALSRIPRRGGRLLLACALAAPLAGFTALQYETSSGAALVHALAAAALVAASAYALARNA